MRTNRMLIMGMALACLLASCKKENNNESKDATYFKASIEQGNGDSKTYLDPDGNVGYVKWSVGDQFKLAESTGSATATFTLVEGEEGKAQSADFICHGFDLEPSYTAAYPAGNVTGISNGTVTFDLPATQSITATGTFGNGAGPMVAAGDGPELSFKNVCGGLGFPLKGAGVHVTGLRLTSNKTTDKLWGTFTVANCTETEPTLTYGTGGSNVIQLVCDVDLTADAQWFYVMLPPGTLTEGFILEVLNGDNVVFTRSTANNPNMVRNVIRGISSDIEIENIPEGAIRGLFTINDSGDKVYFSKGNLQYIGSAATPYWKFADNQWDYLGTTTGQNSDATDVDRDLFGWGTSGWNSGANAYQPYSTSTSYSDYYPGGSYTNNLTGTYANADWGVYNAINNGGTSSWRTLTNAEWGYVFNTRTAGGTVFGTSQARYTEATINTDGTGVNGIILFPDGVDIASSEVTTAGAVNGSSAWGTKCTAAQWTALEAKGCVFLPAAGYRDGTSVSSAGSGGRYWSSTCNYGSIGAYGLYFGSGSVYPQGNYYRYYGFSVRLVGPAE